jgi:methyl coenzyme M reductase beta subunit
MEAVEISRDVDKVLRYIEKNRESILVLRDGRKLCMMVPASRVALEMRQVLRRREGRKLLRGRHPI